MSGFVEECHEVLLLLFRDVLDIILDGLLFFFLSLYSIGVADLQRSYFRKGISPETFFFFTGKLKVCDLLLLFPPPPNP